jgi:lipoprotein signal peptidase
VLASEDRRSLVPKQSDLCDDWAERSARRPPKGVAEEGTLLCLVTIALLLGAGLVTASIDQTSKRAVPAGEAVRRLGGVPVGVRRMINQRGSPFGLSRTHAVMVLIVVASCLPIAMTLGARLPILGAAGLGLALGGATSNLADRLIRGGVIDFIVIGRWPAFNLADAALVCGALMAIGSAV